MPAKQESISFPIRKVKGPRSKSGKAAEQTEKQDAKSNSYNCDGESDEATVLYTSSSRETKTVNSPLGPSRRNTPSRAQVAVHNTRRSSRRKDHPVSYREASVSPQKETFTHHNKERYTPKKLTYEKQSLPECVSSSDYCSTSVTPSKSTNTARSARVSSRNRDCQVSHRERSASPVQPSDKTFTTPKKLLPRRESSPEVTSTTSTCPRASTRSVTPSRNSRSVEIVQQHQTPTKRKIVSPGMCCIILFITHTTSWVHWYIIVVLSFEYPRQWILNPPM